MKLDEYLSSFKLPLLFILAGGLLFSLGIYNSKTPEQNQYASRRTSFRKVSNDSEQISNSGKIDLNKATFAQLVSLPGVGEKTAGKIIQNRPYDSLDKLSDLKIVRKDVLEKIKELVVP